MSASKYLRSRLHELRPRRTTSNVIFRLSYSFWTTIGLRLWEMKINTAMLSSNMSVLRWTINRVNFKRPVILKLNRGRCPGWDRWVQLQASLLCFHFEGCLAMHPSKHPKRISECVRRKGYIWVDLWEDVYETDSRFEHGCKIFTLNLGFDPWTKPLEHMSQQTDLIVIDIAASSNNLFEYIRLPRSLYYSNAWRIGKADGSINTDYYLF